MKKLNSILSVPVEPTLRELLKDEAGKLVVKSNLQPLSSFETINGYAVRLVHELYVSEEFVNFANVLIGNETWRSTFKAVPYNRRLLLLPQCLRNTEKCKAKVDSFGLICAGCRNCNIDELLNVAETLGYTTLVAEGTTSALKLVEEGSVDAVIGVSCMSVLERAFDNVTRAVIPVIGIPLLYNGCENTGVDYNWLIDEIKMYEPGDNYKPLSALYVNNKVKNYFSEQSLSTIFEGNEQVERLSRDIMLKGGQRMRPFLAALSYFFYAKNVNEKVMEDISLIIECFHKASLIHDDIEDNSDERYNKLTLHKEYSVPVAINVGDFLIGKGYSLLSGLDIPDELVTKCLKLISLSHLNMSKGQDRDIMLNISGNDLMVYQLLEIFRNKSGEAVKVAIVLGAIAGKAPEDEIKILEYFAYTLGIAYQIQDDINEFEEEKINAGLNDFPFLVALLNEKRKTEADQTPGVFKSYSDLAGFRKAIHDNGLQKKAREILKSYIEKCYTIIGNLQNLRLRLSLIAALGKVFKPLYTDEA